MALDIYFQEDVARVLDAVDLASTGATAIVNGHINQALEKNTRCDDVAIAHDLEIYRRGHRDALTAVAAAFGINPDSYCIDQKVDPDTLPQVGFFQPTHRVY